MKHRIFSLLLVATLMTACAETDSGHFSHATDHTIFIEGCVHHPGYYAIPSGKKITLEEAIQLAGGIYDGAYFDGERAADMHRIRITRTTHGRKTSSTINASKHSPRGRSYEILPGDSIHIPEYL